MRASEISTVFLFLFLLLVYNFFKSHRRKDDEDDEEINIGMNQILHLNVVLLSFFKSAYKRMLIEISIIVGERKGMRRIALVHVPSF